MFAAAGTRCTHCGTIGLIQTSKRYDHTRCVACGREWDVAKEKTIYPVMGSNALMKAVAARCVTEEKAMTKNIFPDQDDDMPLGTRRCSRCGKKFEPEKNAQVCPKCEQMAEGKKARRQNKPLVFRKVTYNYLRYEAITPALKNRGLTKCQVAYMLGISPSTVSWYATGRSAPEPEMARKLLDLLSLDFDAHYRQVTMEVSGLLQKRRPDIVWDDLHHDDECPAESLTLTGDERKAS